MFYICDPQNQGKNMKKHTAWLGDRGGGTEHSLEAMMGTFSRGPAPPCWMDFQGFDGLDAIQNLSTIEWNWTELIWTHLI